jgi:molybdate transport repressor ModE-like protein
MLVPAIDPDLLRTFSLIAREGSFTRAAKRVGRTQSAVSMQVQRLETLLGRPLLVRSKGGSVQITQHGAWLLTRAQEFLALNDGIVAAFRDREIAGQVRLAIPDDYALRFLPKILRGFAEAHPAVEVDVVCLPSGESKAMLSEGKVDLAVVSEGGTETFPARLLWRGPLMWVLPASDPLHHRDPLPLAMSRAPCHWRDAALAALEQAGRRYRIAYTSESQAGTISPVLAGLAITVSPSTVLTPGLRAVSGGAEGLPRLPQVGVQLLKGHLPQSAACAALERYIPAAFDAGPGEIGNGTGPSS